MMPQLEFKYSQGLDLDYELLFKGVEGIIHSMDPQSGVCKGRAYPAPFFSNQHLLLVMEMLEKPHRDKKFSDTLLSQVKDFLVENLDSDCYLSIELRYVGAYYITGRVSDYKDD